MVLDGVFGGGEVKGGRGEFVEEGEVVVGDVV